MHRGVPEPKGIPGAGVARIVLNYWADKGAEAISTIQNKLIAEKTAERIGIAAVRSPITREPVHGEYVRLLDGSAIIVDRTHPSYWQKQESTPYDELSGDIVSNDLSIGNGGPDKFQGVENPNVDDFFQPTAYERALAQQISRRQN